MINSYGTLELMKLLILYRQNSEHARAVETFMHDYKSHIDPNAPITSYDLDSVEGAETAKLYDVVQYPAFIVTTEDGMVTNMWQGEQLPLMAVVQSYLNQ